MATLTAANASFQLGVLILFPTAQPLQGFDVDDAFSTDPVTSVETKMGVDGFLSAGWVPAEKKMSIVLQADSPSHDLFDAWNGAQEAARTAYVAFGYISVPSLGRSYELVQGYLTAYVPVPAAKKLMQPRTYGLTWRSMLTAPL